MSININNIFYYFFLIVTNDTYYRNGLVEDDDITGKSIIHCNENAGEIVCGEITQEIGYYLDSGVVNVTGSVGVMACKTTAGGCISENITAVECTDETIGSVIYSSDSIKLCKSSNTLEAVPLASSNDLYYLISVGSKFPNNSLTVKNTTLIVKATKNTITIVTGKNKKIFFNIIKY